MKAFLFLKKFFIGICLIYDAVLVSGVLQSESTIYIYVCVCVCVCVLFFRLFYHIGHHRVLSRVPCAIQEVLISYLFYIC